MKKLLTILYRIIALPFAAVLFLYPIIFLYIKSLYEFARYGGEFIRYTKNGINRPTVERIMKRLIEIEKEEDAKDEANYGKQ